MRVRIDRPDAYSNCDVEDVLWIMGKGRERREVRGAVEGEEKQMVSEVVAVLFELVCFLITFLRFLCPTGLVIGQQVFPFFVRMICPAIYLDVLIDARP